VSGAWRFGFGLLAANLSGGSLSAQRPVELGFNGVATFAETDLVAGGLYAAVRPAERVRIALTAGLGVAADATAFRGELLGHFLLSPMAPRGVGVYGLGGVALAHAQFPGGRAARGYLVLGLGIEARPGSGSGWALEAGVGGGLRVALGYRWRRFPSGVARP
jgi:hypothetical protein